VSHSLTPFRSQALGRASIPICSKAVSVSDASLCNRNRASDYESGGRRFESFRARQLFQRLMTARVGSQRYPSYQLATGTLFCALRMHTGRSCRQILSRSSICGTTAARRSPRRFSARGIPSSLPVAHCLQTLSNISLSRRHSISAALSNAEGTTGPLCHRL
jgi:hypothetical protein